MYLYLLILLTELSIIDLAVTDPGNCYVLSEGESRVQIQLSLETMKMRWCDNRFFNNLIVADAELKLLGGNKYLVNSAINKTKLPFSEAKFEPTKSQNSKIFLEIDEVENFSSIKDKYFYDSLRFIYVQINEDLIYPVKSRFDTIKIEEPISKIQYFDNYREVSSEVNVNDSNIHGNYHIKFEMPVGVDLDPYFENDTLIIYDNGKGFYFENNYWMEWDGEICFCKW